MCNSVRYRNQVYDAERNQRYFTAAASSLSHGQVRQARFSSVADGVAAVKPWVRLHEKGGKQHDMPAHHLLETYMDAYLTETGIASDKDTPLFRTAAGRTGTLTDRRMTRTDALR